MSESSEFIASLNDEVNYPGADRDWEDANDEGQRPRVRNRNHSCSDGGGVYCTDACDYCEEHDVEQCDECA
jgi:predicted outer membrane repeat protein